MKECLNCGYERQPKDDGIVSPTECPRCRVIYGKIKYGNESKSFPIPKISIIRSAWIPFILTLPFIIGTVLHIMGTSEIGPFLLVPVFFDHHLVTISSSTLQDNP